MHRPKPDNRIDSPLWKFLAVGVALSLFIPLLTSPGPGITVDMPAWTIVGYLLKTQVVPDQHWFSGLVLPTINAGQELGHTYSMALVLLWLFNQVFSPAVSVKLLCVLSALVYTLGVYAVCRQVAREAFAAFTAVLALVAGGDLMLQGMWYNSLSIGFAFLFWSLLMPRGTALRSRSWVFAVLLYAAAIYTHPLGAIAASVVWATITVQRFIGATSKPARSEGLFLAAIFPCALLLAAPQLAGLLSVQHGGGGSAFTPQSWGALVERLFTIADLRWSAGWSARAAIALVFFVIAVQFVNLKQVSREFVFTLAVLAVTAGTIMLEKPLLVLVDCCKPPFVGSLVYFSDRFRYLWGPLLLILFAISLQSLYERHALTLKSALAGPPSQDHLRPVMRRWSPPLFMAFLLITLIYLAGSFIRSPNQLTLDAIQEKSEVYELWAWLKDNLTGNTRVCFEPTFHSYEIKGETVWTRSSPVHTHILALTGLYVPGVKQIFTGFADGLTDLYSGTRDHFLGVSVKQVNSLPVATVDGTMRRLNCRYAVLHTKKHKDLLAQVKSLVPIATTGRFTVYRNDSFTPSWAFDAEAPESSYRLEQNATNYYTLYYDGQRTAWVHLALAYSAGWTATIDGKPLLTREDRAMLQVEVPGGAQTIVHLRYGERIAKGRALLLMALGAVLLFVIPLLRRRSASAERT